MILELILITVSVLSLVLIYTARMKTGGSHTFLFSESFLNRADEKIFEFIKFIFKLYSLLAQNLAMFISKIPHKIIHTIHMLAHAIAVKSNTWVEKITHNKK